MLLRGQLDPSQGADPDPDGRGQVPATTHLDQLYNRGPIAIAFSSARASTHRSKDVKRH